MSLYCFEIIEFHIVLKVESFGKEHVRCNQNHLGSSKQVIRQQKGMLFVSSVPAKALLLPLSTNFLGRKLLGWRQSRTEIEGDGG